jgi:hypothetical protein
MEISANLLRDEELVDLIAAAGGKWIFIGMESIDPANLADVKKGFNKPGEYAVVLDRLARRNVFAITLQRTCTRDSTEIPYGCQWIFPFVKNRNVAFAHPGQRDFRHTSVFNHLGTKESQPIQATQL